MASQHRGSERAGHVLVVGNLKGGSGKSTLVVNLAGALAASGRRVAIVDCDPQGSAVGWAALGNAPVRVYAEPLRDLTEAPGWLERADWLRAGCDVLLIDLPAVVAPAMAASFLLASVILVPVAPNTVDIEGSRRVLALLEATARERPGWPPRVFLVPVRVRELEGGLEDWRTRLVRLGLPMTSPLRYYSEFDTAFSLGTWVGDRFRGSRANQELRVLAERVLHELDLAPTGPAETAAYAPLAATPRPAWWRRLLGGQRLRTAFSG